MAKLSAKLFRILVQLTFSHHVKQCGPPRLGLYCIPLTGGWDQLIKSRSGALTTLGLQNAKYFFSKIASNSLFFPIMKGKLVWSHYI